MFALSTNDVFLNRSIFSADIDECTAKPNVCGEGNECRNVLGGHVCNCNTGYEATPDGKACVG